MEALCASLEKVVTALGPGFGDWQWRLATLSIKLGGLCILSAGDIIRVLLLSMLLMLSTLPATLTCSLSPLALLPPLSNMMKTLAKCYFCVIEKHLVSKYSLSPRHVSILSCIRAPHAKDFLFTIPTDGLGQRMNHQQFHSVLCYRLAIHIFSKGNLCPSSNAHQMDLSGDHAVHCSSEIGVKFRHNPVHDILVDICSKVWIMVRKKAPMGFLSKDGKDLRLADLLHYNWLQGKDACLD
ncbi:hypothetical protein Tco_1378993 [Tanacetum coccineum]